MKNNEYNIVNVTNEKGTFVSEFTKAQNVEFSFQPENKNTIKDELNDNSTVNDKVEDNLSKATKEKEKKKEEQESEVLESSSSTSSAASSGASSTAGSAASSTAAASSGGVAHAVVAAATVSVAAVGAAVGVVVVAEQKQDQDLITFTSSEIGTNSVEFTFRMPAKLLVYNQDIVEPDQPTGEKAVIYTVKDSTGVVAKDNLYGEQIDEDVFEYYCTITGLSADTAYALTIDLEEQIPDKEPVITQLAERTFRTKAIGPLVTFNSISATSDYVAFSFIVDNATVGFDPESQITPAIQMTVSNSGYYDEQWLESYEQYSETQLICYGDFSGLTEQTTYTLTIQLSTEGELKELGSTTFTTSEATTEFNFLDDQLVVGYSYISFAFEISESEVEQASGSSNINALLESGEDSITVNITSFEESSTSGILIGSGVFTPNDGVTIATSYTLSIVNSSSTTYGSTSVRTMKATIGPINTDTEGEASFAVYVDSDYVGYVEGSSDLPSISASAVRDGEEYATTRLTTFSTYSSSVCKADGTITGLEDSTTYMLYLYYNHDGISELVANKEFTTKEASPTFYFADTSFFYIEDYSISAMFIIKSSEVQEVVGTTAGASNIYMTISGGMGYSQTINIPIADFEDYSEGEGYLFARGYFDNLDSKIDYTISVYNDETTENYGNIIVSTTGQDTGLTFLETTIGTYDIQATIYLYQSYVENTQAVTAQVVTSGGTSVGSGQVSLDATVDDKYQFSVSLTGLDADTGYILGIYYDGILLGVYSFTTGEAITPYFTGATFNDLASYYAHECTLTLDFVDDPYYPQYDNLSIQFYSSTVDSESRAGDILGSLIPLESTTEPQTITIPYTESGGQITYDFDLGDIKSFDILATQQEIFSDDITFIDSDSPGEVNNMITPGCAAINYDEELVALPIQLVFTDDAHEFEDGFTLQIINQNNLNECTTTLTRTENYQYAVFNSYAIMDNVMSGTDDFTLNLYALGGSDILYTDTITGLSVIDINQFYSVEFSDTDINNLDTTTSFSMVYLFGDTSVNTPELVFIDEDSGTEYSYNLRLTSSFTQGEVLTVDLMNDIDSSFSTFNDLASAMANKSFKIIIRCQESSGGSTQEFEIGGGVSFFFSESV